MKLAVITNLITPHQVPLCENFFQILGDQFVLIETMVRNTQLPKGWISDSNGLPYVVPYSKNREEVINKYINNAEYVIIGAADMRYVEQRLHMGKLTFRYAERVYKKEPRKVEMPLRSLKYAYQFNRHKSLYLLCASAFTSADYLRTNTFRSKAYKWGYFPYTKEYDIEALLALKESNDPIEIMWSGRMLDWKHPEHAVFVARYLKEHHIRFHMRVIGSGDMQPIIQNQIMAAKLAEYVEVQGEVSPSEIRAFMEETNIFLFTSDRNEGWGVTLNEAMNAGCVVVANHLVGAVPYLIDGKNGEIYQDGNIDELCQKTLWLINHSEERKHIARNAYSTIVNHWNAKCAAERFLILADSLDKGTDTMPYSDGICSLAQAIRDDWYQGAVYEKEDSHKFL